MQLNINLNCWQAVYHFDAGWPVGSTGRPVIFLPNICSKPIPPQGKYGVCIYFQCIPMWWCLMVAVHRVIIAPYALDFQDMVPLYTSTFPTLVWCWWVKLIKAGPTSALETCGLNSVFILLNLHVYWQNLYKKTTNINEWNFWRL